MERLWKFVLIKKNGFIEIRRCFYKKRNLEYSSMRTINSFFKHPLIFIFKGLLQKRLVFSTLKTRREEVFFDSNIKYLSYVRRGFRLPQRSHLRTLKNFVSEKSGDFFCVFDLLPHYYVHECRWVLQHRVCFFSTGWQ